MSSALRYALRSLQTSRGFALLFVLTLALGLAGVNTIFSLVYCILLRPLPYPHSGRLVTISQRSPILGGGPQVCTLAEFERWQKSGLLDREAAIGTTDLTLTSSDRSVLLYGAQVTPDFFRVFGIQPLLGRGFVAKDASVGNDNVMVLSHELWVSQFASDPAIIGKRIPFSAGSRTVIGVMPARFDFPRLAEVGAIMHWAPEQAQFWTPLTITQQLIDENNYNYYVLGRLRTGIPLERASAQFRVLAVETYREVAQKYPPVREILGQFIKSFSIGVSPLAESMSSGVHQALWMLLGSVALLLLLVLFNLGNLLVTRNANRLREYAVRQALGASRWQLFHQALLEQGVLVTISFALGLCFTSWAIQLIRAAGAGSLPRLDEVSFDPGTLLLSALLALVTALIFGALPLLVLPYSDARFWLATETRSATSDRRSHAIRSTLIGAEIALSMVLLVSAGLLASSFANVLKVQPGFDTRNLLTFTVPSDPAISSDSAKVLVARRDLLARLRAIPGIASATVANVLPLAGDFEIHMVRATGRPFSQQGVRAEYRVVDSDYFQAMRIPLLSGRMFRDDDSPRSVIVNQKMAQQFWPGEDPIGRQLDESDNPPLTVLGVVGNVHGGPLETEPMMQFYSPLAIHPAWAASYAVRTQTDPLSLLPEVEKIVWRFNSREAVSGAMTMDHRVETITLERRIETTLLGGFSVAALFLSVIGLFGVASLSATRRTRETGIRMALGATSADVLQLEFLRNAVLIAAGIASGLVLSLATHRAIAGLLFGTSALNANVYAASATVLAFSAMCAVLLPALRATRVDPAIALRDE